MTCDEPSIGVFSAAPLRASFRHLLAFNILLVLTLGFAGETAAAPSQIPPPIVKGHPASLKPACSSLADCDRRAHDYSGTRGRMGLGANPAHPEGPGNVPN
jgi:hypothetical protein